MSLDIDWKKLDSELAGHVQQFLNKHFQAITKPSFIGDIQVKDFQWGNEAPQIEITNITEPFPEFYEQEDTNEQDADTVKSPSSTNIVNQNIASSSSSSTTTTTTTTTTNTPLIRPQPSPLSPHTESFLSDDDEDTNTTRIPLNTQRFNYMHSFHRSPFVAPQHPFSNSTGLYFSSPPTNLTPNAWNTSHPSSVIEEDWIDDEDINRVSDPSSIMPPPSNSTIINKSSTEMDFQVHMLISYKGDMSMTVITELRMNYPSVMFMSLPINLRVRSVEFEATAVVAYIQSMQRVCVSMLEPEDTRGGGGGINKDIGMDSLLRDVHIETVVGDEQKQVLKNVGKIEKFIVDQLRKILDDELVFPSYQLIQLE